MAYLCEKFSQQEKEGIRILKCRSMDTIATVPDTVTGLPVTELAAYAFSQHRSYEAEIGTNTFWWDEAGGIMREADALLFPALDGDRLEELRLPESLLRAGAYAMYNCGRLKKLEIYSTTLDWGAGVFTGCFGVRELTLHVDEERPSSMKDILAELRQTLDVLYLRKENTGDLGSRAHPSGSGAADSRTADSRTADSGAAGNGTSELAEPMQTRLVFPEYFEEAVENTPARILVTETHGCGQRYRNAFVRTRFQFKEYDNLFAHVQVQEPEELAIRLALGRVMYPYQLEEECRRRYMDYLSEHSVQSAALAIGRGQMEELRWLFEHIDYNASQIGELLGLAGRAGDGAAVSYLMDRKRMSGAVKRRRFSL